MSADEHTLEVAEILAATMRPDVLAQERADYLTAADELDLIGHTEDAAALRDAATLLV